MSKALGRGSIQTWFSKIYGEGKGAGGNVRDSENLMEIARDRAGGNDRDSENLMEIARDRSRGNVRD